MGYDQHLPPRTQETKLLRRRSSLNALALVGLVHLFWYTFMCVGTGFYHDDWVFMERTARAGSFFQAVQAFARADIWNRPVEIVQLPLFYSLAGSNPRIATSLIALLGITEGFLLFLLFDGLLRRRALAILAAVLAVAYPNRMAVHVWLAASPLLVAQVLLLASLLMHRRWLRDGKLRWLAAGQASYLASVLCYESTAFLPVLIATEVYCWTDGHFKTKIERAARALLPYAVSLAIVGGWASMGVPFFFNSPGHKEVAISAHLVSAFWAGFECLTSRVFRICRITLSPALAVFQLPMMIVGIAGVALAVAGVEAWPDNVKSAGRRPWLAVLAALAAGFAGAYLPYALSKDYTPQVLGVMSRTNGAGAWVGGLLVAAALTAFREKLLQIGGQRLAAIGFRSALALVLGAFLWTDWVFLWQWSRSWETQKDVLAKVCARATGLPSGATVLLSGVPAYIGAAVVFDAPYDFNAALRLSSGRTDISGNIVSPRMRFLSDAVIEEKDGQPIARYPYRLLFRYDYSRFALTSVSGPTD